MEHGMMELPRDPDHKVRRVLCALILLSTALDTGCTGQEVATALSLINGVTTGSASLLQPTSGQGGPLFLEPSAATPAPRPVIESRGPVRQSPGFRPFGEPTRDSIAHPFEVAAIADPPPGTPGSLGDPGSRGDAQDRRLEGQLFSGTGM